MGVTLTERVLNREQELWNEYLETIHACCLFDYDEVEPWAWARLQRALNYGRQVERARTGSSARSVGDTSAGEGRAL